jgi:hypothetical protein
MWDGFTVAVASNDESAFHLLKISVPGAMLSQDRGSHHGGNKAPYLRRQETRGVMIGSRSQTWDSGERIPENCVSRRSSPERCSNSGRDRGQGAALYCLDTDTHSDIVKPTHYQTESWNNYSDEDSLQRNRVGG